MKKYLFDKIIVNGSLIRFYSCRHLTKQERFLSQIKFGRLHQGFDNNGIYMTCFAVDNIYEPKSFKQFLTCLELTKLSEKGNFFNIFAESHSAAIPISLAETLKIFIKNTCKDSLNLPKKQIKEFYIRAYDILKKAQNNRETLDNSYEESIN